MNKSLKRFKRVKWINTRLSRKYRTRKNLLPFHIASIESQSKFEIDNILHSDINCGEKPILITNAITRKLKAINKLIDEVGRSC